MDEQEYDQFLTHAEDVLSQSPEMDEANTKAKVVRPLLEALGWEIVSDATLEYGFQMGSSTHHVDFALAVDDTPELFVEAKGSYSDLTDGHLKQLFTYMKTQNVDWGLLTNGRAYYICRRRVTNGNQVVVDVLGELSLADLADRQPLVSALSKQSIVEGRSEELAEKIYELREAYATVQEREEALVNRVFEVLVDELGEETADYAETAARAAVDEIRASLRSAVMGVPSVVTGETFWADVERETGIVKQGSVLVFPESKSATQCFREFVDFLFRNGYLGADEVPIASGSKRYLINDTPTDKEGDEMYSPKEVGDGFYLETNYSRNDIKQRILELGDRYRGRTD